ncbi:hypothetical protein VN12_22615 [Pirellula sp. SH-Sr6A]|uniref:outer membrane lipoprotein-sorting protein n=1 Tax=Pirellula sp. SH-Sr6A TaxID=1632865 RepID=UPI00078BCD5B|nr:outer membrane lipoprotein-sorting protein [Pirellula sp. SH-Sr6A]AMV34937.1 hypothetical protein VN12_22615 [Pirellula sp. SH-Sr6A]
MRPILIYLAAMVAFQLGSVPLLAQDNARDLMLCVLEERTEPIRYEFDFELRDNSFTAVASEKPTEYGMLKVTKGKLKSDELAGFYYVEMETEIVDVLAETKSEEEAITEKAKYYSEFPAMRLILPDMQFMVEPRAGVVTQVSSRGRPVKGMIDFDFRTLGWALDSEHQSKDSLRQILQHRIENCSPDPKDEYTNYRVNDDGIASFRCIGRDYFVDTKRDYGLTKVTIPAIIPRSGGKERVSARTDIELEKLGERWVPSKVKIENFEPRGRSKQEYTFKWESYNKPIPQSYFSEQYLNDRLEALVDAKDKRLQEKTAKESSKYSEKK